MSYKSYLICLVLTYLLGTCYCQENVTTNKNHSFEQFLGHFQNLTLPFVNDTLFYYKDVLPNWIRDSEDNLVLTGFKKMTKSEFLPVISYDTLSMTLSQVAVYKYPLKDGNWMTIHTRVQDYTTNPYEVGQGVWLVLSTYSSGSDLVDTLFLAGVSHELIEQKAEITEDLKIRIRGYAFSPYDFERKEPGPTDEYALEYAIDPKTGQIVCRSSQVRRVAMNETTYMYDPIEPFRPCPCPPKCRH